MHHKILEFSLNANCKDCHFSFCKAVFTGFPWIFIPWLSPQTIRSYLTFHYSDQPQGSESGKGGSAASSKIIWIELLLQIIHPASHTLVNNLTRRTAANLMLLLIMCTLHTGMRARNCDNGDSCIDRPFSWRDRPASEGTRSNSVCRTKSYTQEW